MISCLFLAAPAAAQCYKVSSGNAASLSVDFTNVSAPTATPDGSGGTIYQYTSNTGTTANGTLTIGGTTVTAKDFSLVVTIGANPFNSSFALTIALIQNDSLTGAASLNFGWFQSLFADGKIPAQLPSIDTAWVHIMAASVSPSTTPKTYTLDSVTTCSATPSPAAPAIQSVVNGASFQTGLAPGTWMTITGTNLSATTRPWAASDFVGSLLPASLDHVQATVNGKPAFISYVSPTQVNLLSPVDTAAGPVSVQLTNSQGSSNTFTVNEQATAPGLFVYSQQSGRYAIAQDGVTYALLGPAGLLGVGVTTTPVKPGETIVLYANGLGATNPAFPNGQLLATALQMATLPQVSIGNSPANVLYAGMISPGLYQINVEVPAALAAGDALVEVSAGGLSSAPEYLPIGN